MFDTLKKKKFYKFLPTGYRNNKLIYTGYYFHNKLTLITQKEYINHTLNIFVLLFA